MDKIYNIEQIRIIGVGSNPDALIPQNMSKFYDAYLQKHKTTSDELVDHLVCDLGYSRKEAQKRVDRCHQILNRKIKAGHCSCL